MPTEGHEHAHSRTLNGASLILEHLVQAGVDTVFGVPGGAISPIMQRIRTHPGLRMVVAAHEAGAAFMADGYARSGGGMGVCLVTAGPGATNALTGVAAAHLDGVPLLLVSGQVPAHRTGTTAVQESTSECGVDTAALFRHATGYSTRVPDSASLPRLLRRALSLATSQGCAVHLAVPSDVSRAPAAESLSVQPAPEASGGPPGALAGDELAGVLRQCRRPLFFLGGGARRALTRYGDEFRQCVERMNIPVTTSVRAKGIFPESHPLSLGVFGLAGSRAARAYSAEGIDVLIVLGSRLGEWATGGNTAGLENARVIVHVDADPTVFGQVVPAHHAITGDAGAFIRDLHAATEGRAGRKSDRGFPVRERPEVAHTDSTGRLPASVLISEFSQCMGPDTDVFVDMGNCTGWATRYLTVDPPGRIFIPTGLATMGWSCGAVIGGKAARPDRNAVALVGDGAFLMNGTEVATAARQRLGVVYVVLNDGYLGMVNHGESWESGADLDDPFYHLGSVDLGEFARSLGARAVRIDSPGQLLKELPLALEQAARQGVPYVLTAAVDHLEPPPYGERFATVGSDR
ncbi:thiamine pyrophosphate-binding protein [Streptomyces sp. NPDC005805]|uniref:thiamine pyrophosphate-binding protein n=1 Tax=Streptomyces sp. NPDC005805 TaxID=3157068 RepID=UPI0033E87F6A